MTPDVGGCLAPAGCALAIAFHRVEHAVCVSRSRAHHRQRLLPVATTISVARVARVARLARRVAAAPFADGATGAPTASSAAAT